MQLNQYSLYIYSANANKQSSEEKILVDLKYYDKLCNFCDIENYTSELFGDVHGSKTFEYPNDIKVLINRSDNMIIVHATQKNERIFGKYWELPPDD